MSDGFEKRLESLLKKTDDAPLGDYTTKRDWKLTKPEDKEIRKVWKKLKRRLRTNI